MNHRLLPAAVAGVLSLSLVPGRAASQDLPHELYRLDNGLTVILHEDHTAPQAVVNLWYRVGSKDEPRHRTGFAHLFEHLMFMGTERAPNFDDVMEEGGAWNNASTSPDRTNYYDVGPAEMLPQMLWLEADRLESLADVMTEEKLDIQRGVVLNEYRQNYENRPYAKAGLATSQLLYPKNHPYHIPTIGLPEHIENATLEDVTEFFRTFYVPSNASLCVAGDFDPDVVKPLIEQLFGSLPRGDDPPRQEIPAIELSTLARRTLTDSVRLPMVSMAWHSPSFYAPGDAEMDLIAGLLGDEPSGRLYRRLVVEEGLAAQVVCYQASSLLGSQFMIQVLALPGADLTRLERAVDEELARFAAEGPTAAELDQHRAAYELRLVAPLDSVRERADLLQRYAFYFGEPDALQRDLDRYRGATVESVHDWAREAFEAPGRVVVTVLPEDQPVDLVAFETMPEKLAPRSVTLPEPEVFQLANGLEVRHFERQDLPLVGVRLMLPHGSATDPAGKEGLGALAMTMLDEGTGELDAAVFANELGTLGAELDSYASEEASLVSLTVLPRNLAPALDLMRGAVCEPALLEAEFERVKGTLLEGLRSESDDPSAVASRVQRAAWYGIGQPLAHPPEGSPASVERITLADVRTQAAGLARPDGAILFTAGPVPTAEIRAELEQRFGTWGRDVEAAEVTVTGVAGTRWYPQFEVLETGHRARDAGLRVVFCDSPGATQTQVRFVGEAPRAGHADQVATGLLATVLGGTFTSRLNQNLREDKTWTYGARARYVVREHEGLIEAAASVQADKSGPSVAEFLSEFAGLRSANVTEFELAKSSASQRQRTVERMAGLGGLLSMAVRYERLGQPLTRLAEELDEASRIELGTLNALAPTAYSPTLLVLVGDARTVLPQLEDLREAGVPLPAVEHVDSEGRPLDSPRKASARN